MASSQYVPPDIDAQRRAVEDVKNFLRQCKDVAAFRPTKRGELIILPSEVEEARPKLLEAKKKLLALQEGVDEAFLRNAMSPGSEMDVAYVIYEFLDAFPTAKSKAFRERFVKEVVAVKTFLSVVADTCDSFVRTSKTVPSISEFITELTDCYEKTSDGYFGHRYAARARSNIDVMLLYAGGDPDPGKNEYYCRGIKHVDVSENCPAKEEYMKGVASAYWWACDNGPKTCLDQFTWIEGWSDEEHDINLRAHIETHKANLSASERKRLENFHHGYLLASDLSSHTEVRRCISDNNINSALTEVVAEYVWDHYEVHKDKESVRYLLEGAGTYYEWVQLGKYQDIEIDDVDGEAAALRFAQAMTRAAEKACSNREHAARLKEQGRKLQEETEARKAKEREAELEKQRALLASLGLDFLN